MVFKKTQKRNVSSTRVHINYDAAFILKATVISRFPATVTDAVEDGSVSVSVSVCQ